MSSEVLEKARVYEAEEELKITKVERPAFHLSPRIGWMNDPNGFTFYKGQYHMFYQYHPYNTNWGPMHWGHAVSEDLMHWNYLPAALAPDQEYDKFGCFSGSAVELEDGRQLLMYTGVSKADPEDPSSADVQTQCIAVGDGVNYEKYEGNPVLTSADLPAGASKVDFRDPKMWKDENGGFGCVIGSRPEDGSGQILYFHSEDGFHWNFVSILSANRNRFGKMWECPDFFELDGKYVLVTSPQDMLPQGVEYAGGNGTLCMIGEWKDKKTFVEEQDQSVDYGIDFYAPQTILSPDGRRIMIGWMQNWDTCSVRKDDMKWYGQMSLPRELSLVDGRMIQKPLTEINQLHKDTVSFRDVLKSESKEFAAVCGRKIDLELEVEPEDAKEMFHSFTIQFAQNDTFYSELRYQPRTSMVELDRRYSGVRRASVHQGRCQVKDAGGTLKIRVILDRYSAEIFLNDGQQVMTMTLYTELEARGIRFIADGSVKLKVTKSDLDID